VAIIRAHRVAPHYELGADVRGAGRIVSSEASGPGWRGRIDDQRAKVERANRAFLAFYVPPGRHHIRVGYRPDAFVFGRAISLAALIAFAAITLVRARRRRRVA